MVLIDIPMPKSCIDCPVLDINKDCPFYPHDEQCGTFEEQYELCPMREVQE